jgi:hypothetical protein
MSGVLVVLANSVESREDEFNDWYSEVHVPEILALPSFLSARRFRLDRRAPTNSSHGYLTVYEVSDAAVAAAELQTAGQAGHLTMSDALDAEAVTQGFFTQI